MHLSIYELLSINETVEKGSWVETGDIFVGKLTSQVAKESSYAPEDRLLRALIKLLSKFSKSQTLQIDKSYISSVSSYINTFY